MNTKNIEAVIAPKEPHFVGDGFRVHNFIPSGYHLDMRRMDPFIMLDYNSKFNFPATDKPKGVGVHPHRGFETVTIAYQGSVSHHDSSGGGGTIHQGDVQWMTAASGVLHKEYHAEEFYKKGGIFQMVQLWVNLPAKDKMSTPKYQAIEHKAIPTVEVENGFIEVIAGEYNQTKGAASTFSPVNMLNAKLNVGGKANFSFPANYNTLLLVIEGEVKVNEQEIVPTDHLLLFTNEGEDFSVEATENSVVLILSGEPLNEPIASYGPFVMNTQEQIREAFEDYNNGKFGTLEE
ncbi:pirin family protein [Empedobacter brevis]|uniref:Quercetin 2,3-dioxygenase n=1 Tax=Empedobacter brevis NBRC 14943 = ATCC 43319 TaxID=1218108 RepID=A0A511NEC8_9FLAO|nr:pirin family protein [Empedobacter brevis]GEM50956.1 quercetin 2,3-dioxygenase [Empedobacter brevis NBRC 14943 = ATCC 43319]